MSEKPDIIKSEPDISKVLKGQNKKVYVETQVMLKN